MLQHSWSLQAVQCFYYSAFSSQHRSLHWNTTWHLAKHTHPLILPQSTLFRHLEHITVPNWEESLQKMGSRGKPEKKPHSPGLNTWFLNSGSRKQWSHSGLPDFPFPGSSVKPVDFSHFSFLVFLHRCTDNSCRTMTDFVKKLFQICCLNQDHSNPDISNTNLATHFKKLQFCAILQSFPYEEGTKLKPFSFPSYGPNQYSPSLQKHMHKIWGRMRPASYCYLVSICINSFSDSVLFAKFIWLPTSGRGDFSEYHQVGTLPRRFKLLLQS